ncbi:hypothetical protein [Azovibrio restrictus]|uniref:hypothetical protein n=1 Tax=Azovibrio restrictus TaxID=146938 RepID=UPI0026EDEEAC|nr:hypothetical protein [Azovibrio restrictus]
MARHERPRTPRQGISRTRVASTAARLMAQDGITDIGLAKKKAARLLGLPESTTLPDNNEVEAELRLYQALYQSETQPAKLRQLREEAARIMEILADFRPYLTGAVLEGTAGTFSAIDLMLFADSAKEVEIFLLDQGMDFEHVEPRHEKAEAALQLFTPRAEFNLLIFPPRMERHTFHHRDGRPRERARLDTVKQLLAHTP